jgi:hypothetical protein
MRDEYLEREGILVRTGERSWALRPKRRPAREPGR